MNIKNFDKVIKKNNNGEYVGVSTSDFPQYKEIMKNFKIEFNDFVKTLQTDKLEVIGLHKNYQNSGYYNKYFWAKLVFRYEYRYEDIAIWIGVDREGIFIYLGTSDKIKLDKNSVYNFFHERVTKKEFDNFILDDTTQYIRYKYIAATDNLNQDTFINVIEYLTPIYKEALDKFVFNNTNKLMKDNIKNIILYGPPGVGKTHNYQRLISMIEEGENEKIIFDTITNNQSSEAVSLNKEIYQKINEEKRVEFITFHQSYSYEDFIEGFRPTEDGNIKLEDGIFKIIAQKALKNSKQNYYIIIDEINRGNISKIFGELITLIEEDKRSNYEVTLPYSKEKFIIPSNLYIIATMNSTDKSIATIDIALRRRFTFLKMRPNSNLVGNKEAQKLMLSLNEYIEKTLGADFLLGHSYFMGADIDLDFIKEYKIKPLLEEYFYSDENIEIDKLLKDVNDT